MFNALYPEATDAAIDAQIRRPPDAAPPIPWFRGFWSAAGKVLPRAGAEMGRTMTALQTPEAVGALDAPTMFSAPTGRAKADLSQELRQQDAAIRDAIKEMTPDPETTGAASMIVHDVGRFVGKATGYSLLGGTPAAILGTGLDEGYNEAARRMDEGVDQATATKLGVVKGVASAAAVALPVAGKTVGQTLLLAGAGGPGTYIAEQLTARKILEGAGYDEQASQIDPFDPLGLGVSFFSSLLFGAGAHGARRLQARWDSRAADARMLEASRPPGERTAVAEGVERAYTREQVDAAHVTELVAHREAQALHAREDVAAGDAHLRALDRASEQLATGQRVSVGEIAPADVARMVESVLPAVRRAVRVLDEVTAARSGQVDATMRAMVDGRQAGYLDYTVFEGRPQISMVEVAEEFRRQGIGAELVRELQRKFPESELDWGMLTEAGAALREALPKVIQDVGAVRAKLGELEAAVKERAELERQAEAFHEAPATEESRAQYREFIQKNGDRWNELHDRIDTLQAELAGQSPTRTLIDTAAPGGKAQVQDSAGLKSLEGENVKTLADGADQPKSADQPSADYLARESDRIVQADPDLMVMMEGMDAPVRAADLLAEVQAMAKQEAADAPLLKVAAECALRG